MATSTFKGYIRFDASAQVADEKPIWAGIARDHLVNNACHVADEAGQVLVNWTASNSTGYATPFTPIPATGTWYRIKVIGPVPLLMKGDGTSYQLRVRCRGYTSAAGTVKFYVTVGAPGEAVTIRETGAGDSFQTSSTTDAWIAAAGGTNLISLGLDGMVVASVTKSTLDAVNGSPVTVRIPLADVTIWAQTTDVNAVPRLTGLYLAEYVGT